jgi:GAF domain-containing protein
MVDIADSIIDEDPAAAVAADLSHTASMLFAAGSVDATLQQVVDLATDTIEGCDFAGIFFRDRSTTATWVRTDPIVVDMDALQLRLGEGPCFDAVREGTTFYGEDLTSDERWPRFTPEAMACGVRSVLALHLAANAVPGSLNLYARYPKAFGVIDRGKAVILATLAGIAITSAQEHADEKRQIDNLAAALAAREMIGQAQGILMERERVTADEAFDILRRASQHLNRKLREVAQDLVETGERPDTGSAPGPLSR